ncbi:DivIVA domain-containing protein [Gordonia alkaliphila]|uniref:DivIVA domain-containing protein n=1 Tax=Gordonia alkaliphila TaxID=1053547 RepID=UPI0027E30769|nr:DivIVA domain-containing protein [Gordonia alkaliphila]
MTTPNGTTITAADVHHVAFPNPPFGRRGYDTDIVDNFLDSLEAKFADPANPELAWLTPQAIREISFRKPPLGMRGYRASGVDAFLEACAAQLEQHHP